MEKEGGGEGDGERGRWRGIWRKRLEEREMEKEVGSDVKVNVRNLEVKESRPTLGIHASEEKAMTVVGCMNNWLGGHLDSQSDDDDLYTVETDTSTNESQQTLRVAKANPKTSSPANGVNIKAQKLFTPQLERPSKSAKRSSIRFQAKRFSNRNKRPSVRLTDQ